MSTLSQIYFINAWRSIRFHYSCSKWEEKIPDSDNSEGLESIKHALQLYTIDIFTSISQNIMQMCGESKQQCFNGTPLKRKSFRFIFISTRMGSSSREGGWMRCSETCSLLGWTSYLSGGSFQDSWRDDWKTSAGVSQHRLQHHTESDRQSNPSRAPGDVCGFQNEAPPVKRNKRMYLSSSV